jgi:hypothetical protein
MTIFITITVFLCNILLRWNFFANHTLKHFSTKETCLETLLGRVSKILLMNILNNLLLSLTVLLLLLLNTFFLRTVCLNIILDLDLLMNIRDNLDLIILFMKIFILYEIILISKEFPNSITSQFLVNDFVGKKWFI